MSNSESNSDKSSASRSAESALKEIIENRLHEAGVRVARSISVNEGTKATVIENHTDPSNQTFPGLIDGNHTIHGGDGLVLIDIDTDDISQLPDWLQDLPETLIIESPHGGYHLYYAIEDDIDISNSKGPWGSIRYEGWYTLGPGSTIDHDGFCGNDCDEEGIGTYDIHTNKPIPTLSGDHLDALRDACDSSGGSRSKAEEYGRGRIDLPDEGIYEEANEYLCSELLPKTKLFAEDMMDLLKGGTGQYELRRDDGTGNINRSAAESYALDGLYGAFRYRGEEPEDARRIALHLFKHYCWENPYDKTGNLRKWLARGEQYLNGVIDDVQENFDAGQWHRWRRSQFEGGFATEEHRPWMDPSKDGEPSLIAKDTVRAAMWTLTGGMDIERVSDIYGLDLESPSRSVGKYLAPRGSISACDFERFPTAKEVGAFCAELNPEREASYFTDIVRRLSRETEEIAHAYCPSRPNGERHVYYLSGLPDPRDARWVKVGGEKREPEPEQPEEAAETDVMTDGGTRMETSEAKRDIKRVQQVREENAKPTEEPELYRCPIEGCSRTVIDDPSSLRSHVRQAGDDSHQFRTLNEDLDIEFDEEAYHATWGPGAQEQASSEPESIYEPDDPWGPGVPERVARQN